MLGRTGNSQRRGAPSRPGQRAERGGRFRPDPVPSWPGPNPSLWVPEAEIRVLCLCCPPTPAFLQAFTRQSSPQRWAKASRRHWCAVFPGSPHTEGCLHRHFLGKDGSFGTCTSRWRVGLHWEPLRTAPPLNGRLAVSRHSAPHGPPPGFLCQQHSLHHNVGSSGNDCGGLGANRNQALPSSHRLLAESLPVFCSRMPQAWKDF